MGQLQSHQDKHKAPTLPCIRPLSLQNGATSLPDSVVNIHQEIESPGLGDGLGAALYSQFAADVQDVLLDRVHTEH
jgi:hypothetical protein